jgi:hypothetical protein
MPASIVVPSIQTEVQSLRNLPALQPLQPQSLGGITDLHVPGTEILHSSYYREGPRSGYIHIEIPYRPRSGYTR